MYRLYGWSTHWVDELPISMALALLWEREDTDRRFQCMFQCVHSSIDTTMGVGCKHVHVSMKAWVVDSIDSRTNTDSLKNIRQQNHMHNNLFA